MHPKKAAQLATYDKLSRLYAELMRRQAYTATRPDRHGIIASASAAVSIPFITLAAFLSDVSYVATSHTSDATWELAFPTRNDATPPNEEL